MIKVLKFFKLYIGRLIKNLVYFLGFLFRKIHTPQLPVNADGKVYVNLGCGANTSKEFINIDTRTMPNTHYIKEIQDLGMFKDNTVDLLYASHVIEHLPRKEINSVFREWHRVLKPGGVLRFGVPDFDSLLEIYNLSGKDVTSIENQLLGQNEPYDDHHTIWNFEYAKNNLEKAGFKNIRKWDYKNADHHDFIDKTMREVKIKDKSILISLNIEASK